MPHGMQADMKAEAKRRSELFDDWPETYDRWFATPIGTLVKEYEERLLHDMLKPRRHDLLLDVGCGTGIFTAGVLAAGSRVVGMDISRPMISAAAGRFGGGRFMPLTGDMRSLPFADNSFDKVYSMTAIEFVEDARSVVEEFERVAKPGGTIVLTTLNRLSPWAESRLRKADSGHELFKSIIFRTPAQMRGLVPDDAVVTTAIHFLKTDDPVQARRIEAQGSAEGRESGAFLAVCWMKK